MPDLVICGIANIDCMARTDQQLLKPGGNASHIALAFKQLSVDTSKIGFCVQLGKDYSWGTLFSGFNQDGIDYTDELSNRVIFKEVDGTLRFSEFQQVASNKALSFPNTYQEAKCVLIGALTPKHVFRIISCYNGIVALNYSPWFDEQELYKLVPRIDILILNRAEALKIFGSAAIHSVYDQLKHNNKIKLIITKDADGCEYFDGKEHVIVPAPLLKCIWKYGAGAVFSSMYLYHTLHRNDVVESLIRATAIASIYISDQKDRLNDVDFFATTCKNLGRGTLRHSETNIM